MWLEFHGLISSGVHGGNLVGLAYEEESEPPARPQDHRVTSDAVSAPHMAKRWSRVFPNPQTPCERWL